MNHYKSPNGDINISWDEDGLHGVNIKGNHKVSVVNNLVSVDGVKIGYNTPEIPKNIFQKILNIFKGVCMF